MLVCREGSQVIKRKFVLVVLTERRTHGRTDAVVCPWQTRYPLLVGVVAENRLAVVASGLEKGAWTCGSVDAAKPDVL